MVKAGIGENSRKEIHDRIASSSPVRCGNQFLTSGDSLPSPADYAKELRRIACSDRDAARGILRNLNDEQPVELLFLVHAAADKLAESTDCSGLQGLEDEIARTKKALSNRIFRRAFLKKPLFPLDGIMRCR